MLTRVNAPGIKLLGAFLYANPDIVPQVVALGKAYQIQISLLLATMISTETRLRLEEIARRLETGEEVSFTERVWADKWAKHNAHAGRIIRNALRTAFQGPPKEGSIDELLHVLDLGDPDPSNHRIGIQTPDELADFFHNEDNDRLKRD